MNRSWTGAAWIFLMLSSPFGCGSDDDGPASCWSVSRDFMSSTTEQHATERELQIVIEAFRQPIALLPGRTHEKNSACRRCFHDG
jgi:hypothetical protein